MDGQCGSYGTHETPLSYTSPLRYARTRTRRRTYARVGGKFGNFARANP